jgi:hypothetical protein
MKWNPPEAEETFNAWRQMLLAFDEGFKRDAMKFGDNRRAARIEREWREARKPYVDTLVWICSKFSVPEPIIISIDDVKRLGLRLPKPEQP